MFLKLSHTFIFSIFITFALFSCKKDDEITSPPIDYSKIDTIQYSKHIQPLLNEKCATSGCHNSASKAAGLSLASWNEVMGGSTFGEAIVAFKSSKSLLTTLFDGTPLRVSHRSLGEKKLTNAEVTFLKRWIDGGAKNDAKQIPFAHSMNKLYVPNQGEDNVAIIDIDSMVVIRYVDVGNSPGNDAPHFIVAKGEYWYVSLINTGQVWKFSAHTDTLIGIVHIPGAPALLSLSPDGGKLFVSQFMSATQQINKIYTVNTSSMLITDTITVGTMPHGIRVNNSGTRLYIANMLSDNISVVDVATNELIENISVAFDANPFGQAIYQPMEIAVSPNDSFVVVTCSGSAKNEVRLFSVGNSPALTLIDSFPVAEQPWHVQFIPNNNDYCYVTNRKGNTLSEIHLPMRMVMNEITNETKFDFPHGVAISGDGKYVFVSNENQSILHNFIPRYNNDYVGNVCMYERTASALQFVKALEVGKFPTGLSIVE
ncbi:MAG: YncE family protein [Ignavibacteriales bacterium]|nr:YncE family protein [Ignavibacteriales bacterium]